MFICFAIGFSLSWSPSSLASSSQQSVSQCSLTSLTTNEVTPLNQGRRSNLSVDEGDNNFRLECELRVSSVLVFQRTGFSSYQWQDNGVTRLPIPSGDIAYAMEPGEVNARLQLQATVAHTPRFVWYSKDRFTELKQQQALILGAFYGLCFTLIFYVLIISYKLKQRVFRLYSAYIAALFSFVFFQEGHLYLFIHPVSNAFVQSLYLLSIGLTVLTATWFMSAILNADSDWPKVSKTLKALATIVLLTALVRIIAPDLSWLLSGIVMGYGTLFIVAAVVGLAIIQWQRNVNEAGLVLVALLVVLISMIFRIVLLNQVPFVQRYGFVIAFAIESLMLAIAISRRIQGIQNDKLKAENDANFDSLCNILNRRGWQAQANQLLSAHRTEGGLLALFYIDVDHFKDVNDKFGHHAGDRLLQVTTQMLKQQMRHDDAVGRIGGDEFVVLARFHSEAEAHHKAKQLNRELGRLSINVEGVIVTATASFGMVMFNRPPQSVEEILKHGDKEMYKTKRHREHLNASLVN